jgi:hypothetical protein
MVAEPEKPDFIYECPICSGNLQATVVRFTCDVRLTPTGFLDRVGEIQEQLSDDAADATIYCENDHTIEEIREQLRTLRESEKVQNA